MPLSPTLDMPLMNSSIVILRAQSANARLGTSWPRTILYHQFHCQALRSPPVLFHEGSAMARWRIMARVVAALVGRILEGIGFDATGAVGVLVPAAVGASKAPI